MVDRPTRPSEETREAERDEARQPAGAGRGPTPEEEKSADSREVDEGVAEHEREMLERGASQQGEGRLP